MRQSQHPAYMSTTRRMGSNKMDSHNHGSGPSKSSWWWKAVFLVGFGCLLVVNHAKVLPQRPELIWDYNHFDDRLDTDNDNGNSVGGVNHNQSAKAPDSASSTATTATATLSSSTTLIKNRTENRNLLLVQIASRQDGVADITTRPNRAYARHWGYDFLLYRPGSSSAALMSSSHCSSVSEILRDVVATTHSSRDGRPSKYDMVLFLRDDSVVLDLEFDLRTLLPMDKLAALPGNADTGISIWNTRHDHFEPVSQALVDTPSSLLCTDDAVIQETIAAQSNSDQVVVLSSSTSGNGFVDARHLLHLPNYNTMDSQAAAMKLQAVTNSVCYRYFPKCEILE